jgi:hypothetical protein
VTSCRDILFKAAVVKFLVLLLVSHAFGQDKAGGITRDDAPAAEVGVEETAEHEDVGIEGEEATKQETHTLLGGFAGYRFLSVNSFGGRAAPYDYLHSSPVGGAFINSLGKDLKFSLDGAYTNEKDYYGDLLFDYAGDYRFHLRTESLFHNLSHELLFFPPFTLPPSVGAAYTPVDLDPAGRYGIQTEQNHASFRLKLHDFPLHLNLGYWGISREGNRQLIFADQAFEGAQNFIFSSNRPINQQTHEGNFGFDAHLGYVDVIYNFRIRQFNDSNQTPVAFFAARSDLAGNIVRNAGFQQHNEDPDSRFISHTIKLHTSLSGGLVGAASYTYGRRENLSNLTDVRGADQTVATLQNMAGDIAYTPCGWFTLALKYRRQEVDNNNPAAIFSAFDVSRFVAVRPALDTSKDTITTTLSVRPSRLLTFKGEFKGEFLHRDNVSAVQSASVWYLPENTDQYTGTVSILSRPLTGLRLKALYSYSTTVHPSYGTSFAERNEGQLLATYNRTGMWGMTANYRARRDSNDEIIRNTIVSVTPLEYSPYFAPLGRNQSTDNATMSIWFTPLNKLTITGSYGFLRSSADQAVLFTVINTATNPAIADATNYTNQAQIYSLNLAYQFNDRLDLSLLLQQVRSFSEFMPQFLVTSGTSNTAGINLISRTNTVESSLSMRAHYQMTKNLSCAVDYTYRDYDEKNTAFFNGSVNTIIAYLSAKW